MAVLKVLTYREFGYCCDRDEVYLVGIFDDINIEDAIDKLYMKEGYVVDGRRTRCRLINNKRYEIIGEVKVITSVSNDFQKKILFQ